MDFIRVTLVETLFQEGKKIKNIQRQSGYLLPTHAIASVSKNILQEEGKSYYILISEAYLPKDIGFVVGHAEADLPAGFIRILNE